MDWCVLPADLVMEILTRSSAETVASSRVTSREVYNMTYDSVFRKHFHDSTNHVSGYFFQGLKRNKYFSTFVSNDDHSGQLSLKFLPHSVKIEASTKQGILCCKSQDPAPHHYISKYYVCKPCTKQWEQIPNPKTRYYTLAVAMMVMRSKPLHYKIVRLSQHKQLPQSLKGPLVQYLHCEVFDSKDRKWKKLQHIAMGYCEFFQITSPTISSGGMAHWLTTKHRILTFDFSLETFDILEVPRNLFGQDYGSGETIVEYKGKLGFMTAWKKRYLELWVMNNHIDRRWKKKLTLDLEEIRRIKDYPCLYYPYSATCHDADCIVTTGRDNVTFYNTKNGCSSVIRLNYTMNYAYFYPFHSDYELVDMKNHRY